MTEDALDEESLRQLAVLTAKLPREIAPPASAWDGISTAIESSRRNTTGAQKKFSRPVFWQQPVFLAAAGLLLVAGSSAITMVAMNRSNAEVVASTPARAITTAAPATLAEFTAAEKDYISTANRLSAILESGDTQLAPETKAKLKESLSIIDSAILEARRALAADPANEALIDMLSTTYNQKLDLLRRTTEMGRS